MNTTGRFKYYLLALGEGGQAIVLNILPIIDGGGEDVNHYNGGRMLVSNILGKTITISEPNDDKKKIVLQCSLRLPMYNSFVWSNYYIIKVWD